MEATPFRIAHARTFLARLGGLLVRDRLCLDEALCLAPCSGVHTFFMRYPIDVAFLDGSGRVMKLRTLAPWRAASCRGASAVLELQAGRAAAVGLAIGDVVDLQGEGA